jgi:2'-5' RNA ligase
MPFARHALVAYISNSVGQFVEDLRRELHPPTAHMAAHLTILPPRELSGSENSALQFLEDACRHVEPFDVNLGEVTTFMPVTPTIFIQVTGGAARMRELHDQFSTSALCCPENWPYIPHLTIAKMEREQQVPEAFAVARERWSHFPDQRQILVTELMFVRENGDDWQDVALLPLSGPITQR